MTRDHLESLKRATAALQQSLPALSEAVRAIEAEAEFKSALWQCTGCQETYRPGPHDPKMWPMLWRCSCGRGTWQRVESGCPTCGR